MGYRVVEDLLAERGVIVSREVIRHRCIKFGKIYTPRLKKHKGFGDIYFFDEAFVKNNIAYGERLTNMERLLMCRCNLGAMELQLSGFFKRILSRHDGGSRNIVTGRLKSYGAARRKLIPHTIHNKDQNANNRPKQSHGARRVGERSMRNLKSDKPAQNFPDKQAA